MRARKPSALKISSLKASSLSAAVVDPVQPAPLQVRGLFDRIAADYDRFNAWASLGLHHRWRRALTRRIPAGVRVLDIATGTGDVAFQAQQGHEVVGLDFSEAMLARAREKDATRKIRWINGSADRLPFSDRSFGCVTSAFALRNLRSILDGVFHENFRILRSGGVVLHMDFGRPVSPISRLGHHLHVTYGVPFLGQHICGDRWPKGYLEGTIEQFYAPAEVEERLSRAGFSRIHHTPLLWGTVVLYEAWKA